MSTALHGRVVVVTGAATGIGRSTAEHLLARGAAVFGLGLDADEGAVLAAELERRDLPFRFRETDVTDDAAVRDAVGDAVERFGRIDGVVNGAAVHQDDKRLDELTDAEWDRVIAVNLTAAFRVCRAVIPHLRAGGGGSIVNVASVHAIATMERVPAYAASKAALLGLSRQMALDYARDRIRVNALIVGSVATRMTLDKLPADGDLAALGLSFDTDALPRIAAPAEIARAIGFLLSDDASFVTGSGMTVDGGLTAKLL